jgi:NTP pyrophosphatase (non-canonical NTP hydrolase)
MKLDYGPQINKYLEPYMQNPQVQQLLKQFTPQQLQQAVADDPQLLKAIEDVEPKQTPQKTQRLLDKLQEEASEVIQVISKIRRFGPDSSHPDRKATNKQELVGELEDLLALVAVLESQQYFDLTQSRDRIRTKAEALLK